MLPDRVLMTADTVGGVWTYALELARALSAYGTRITLATMGRSADGEQRRSAAALRNLELVESSWRLEWMADPWSDVERAGEWLLDLERRHQPDVVHLNGYAHGALPWRAPVLVVGHSCVLSWWRAVKRSPAPPEWSRYRVAVREGLSGAELVVAPTRAMLRELEELYGPLPAARVIPNGRQLSFTPGRKEPLLLCVGRLWDEGKNLQLLEAAAGRVPWPVYVAGDTRTGEGGHRVPAGVRPLGRLDELRLRGWLARASIYVHPALYEPFGLSVLEAALAGCALVLGDIASLRENWEGAASFVDPRDAEALAASIRALAADSARRLELAGRARARARELSPDRMARAYLSAYGWLLGRGWEERACAS
jgi:glycogen(starch) synthase